MGGILVLPPHERRVPVVDGMRLHFDQAIGLPFPLHSRLRSSALSSDLQVAIRISAGANSSLPSIRDDFIEFAADLSSRLRPVSRHINTLMPPTVSYISAHVNTAFLGVLVDGLGWLDVSLLERFVHGFPIVGIIPDSGVYRLLDYVESLESAAARFRHFSDSAPAYNRALERRMRYRQWATASGREADAAVASATVKERSKALVIGPFTSLLSLHHALFSRAPSNTSMECVYPRCMPRFAVPQKGAYRAIDDGKSNGANAATRMLETVTTPSFFFPAIVARGFVDATPAGAPTATVAVALADLASAYRTIPTSQPWFTAFAMWDPAAERVHFYFLPGHNFGLTSAVVNFNRFPELVVVAVRALAAVPCDHYFDDIIVADSVGGGNSGLRAVQSIMLALGRGAPRLSGERIQSPELDPKKTYAPALNNTVLGVVADTSASAAGSVFFYVHPDRVAAVLKTFRDAFVAGVLYPHEAASLRGKLYFSVSAAFASVGRAATLPLVQRQYRDTSIAFLAGSELHHCLLFFEALLPSLPPLTVSLRPSSVPPLTVYTDASFRRVRGSRLAQRALSELASGPSGSCPANLGEDLKGDLGAVVYDPVDGTVRVAHAAPPWRALLRSWSPHHKTFIAQLEVLAAVSVYSTYPELFVGRSVHHWIDNTVALSSLVHGYSGKPDLAKMVNVAHLQLAGLRTSVYFDYVPSKANIADLPSRRAFAELHAALRGVPRSPGSTTRLSVPNVATWHAPIKQWLTRHLHLRPGASLPA